LSNGPVEQIRIFKLAKDSAVKAKRQAVNQMHALLVNADPELREELSGLGRKALVSRCAAFDPHSAPGVIGATKHTLRTLAPGRRNPLVLPGRPGQPALEREPRRQPALSSGDLPHRRSN
jgi:hypothetical protein